MNYKIINSMLDLPTFDKDQPVFCDIETDDLYGPLRMIQMYQPSTDPTIYIIDIAPMGYDESDYQTELLNIKHGVMRLHTVWYNSSYDLGTMNLAPDKVDDMFYIMKLAYPEFMEFGLKKIVKKLRYTQGLYSGVDTKEAVKGFVKGAYISKEAYKYGALDVYALGLMWEDMKVQKIRTDNMAYKVDMLSQNYALQYQQNGLVLNREMWSEELIKAQADVVTYTALLPLGFNPNSFKQVRAYLDTNESDAAALITYALSDKPKAKDADYIIKLKRAKKQVSYLKSIEFDKMYTKFNVAGAITGRFTSAGGCLRDHFNAQQIPRNYQFLFNQATDDTEVIGLDYSTLELRLACAIFGSETMYKQLKSGADLHTEMARVATGKSEITKQDRQRAKGINFGYVYGMSSKSYVPYAFTNYGIKVTLDEASELRNKYFALYPEFKAYHNMVWNNYKKPSFTVSTALGRRVKPKLGTDGINSAVQGTGVEVTKLAVHYLAKEYPETLGYIYNVIHDSIYMRVPKDSLDQWRPRLETAMLKAWEEMSKTAIFKFNDIPMMVD